MANKKISELESRASLSLSDLMAVGDPSTGYLYKTTISDLKTLTGAGVVSFNGRFGTVNPAEGDYTLTQLGDVIITSPSNGQVLQYNGSNWVNAAYPAETDTLNSVTTRGNTTGNVITVGGITAGTTGSAAYHTFYSSTVNDGSTVTIAAENLSANASRSQIMISDLSGGAGKRFGIGVYTGASPYSYLDAATKLVFQQSGGNVIIGGIVDAGFKLDVVGGFRSALSAGHFIQLDPANYRYLVNISNTQTLQDSENITLTVNGSGYIAFQTALVNRFVVNNSGTITISSLAGTGSRMVVANASGLLSTQAIPDLTGYVTLGTAQTITGEKIFSTAIGAVGGISLRDTVGGSNYGGIIANSAFFQISAQGGSAILIKASDGTNALTIGTTGNTLMTNVTAASFIRSGGTSSQFLKADGSVDSNTYLTSASVSGVYLPLSGGTLTGGLILSPASGAASITMNAPTGQLNEIVFKVNSTNVGWMYVNASYFQFNSSTSGGYLFKNTAGANILAMTDAGAATFSSSVTAGGVRSINGGVDGAFQDAFVGAFSSNNNEQNAIQTTVSSVANWSGFRFQASNGGGSSIRTTVVDFLRDRQLFYGNVGINTTDPTERLDVIGTIKATELSLGQSYSTSVTTNSSWSSFQTIIPGNTLEPFAVYLITASYSVGDQPYNVTTSFTLVVPNCNGGGADNSFTPICATHTGGSGTMSFRTLAVGGQAAAALQIQFNGFANLSGNLVVRATRLRKAIN